MKDLMTLISLDTQFNKFISGKKPEKISESLDETWIVAG